MQKKLKLATVAITIFFILVFTVKYFYTTNKVFTPSYSDTTDIEFEEALENKKAENTEDQVDEETLVANYNMQAMEELNYNTPVTAVDPKSVKKEFNRRLNYSNYEDRIRMSNPAKLDFNGLYVALMQSVGDNDIERARDLLRRGAMANSPDGNTSYAPIFWAISNGNVEMIRLLLQSGARLNTPDEKGSFPIHWVVESSASRPSVYQMKNIFDLILDAEPGEINRQETSLKRTPIMMAANLNDKKAFAYLLDRGANVKILDIDKRDVMDILLERACHACIHLIESKEKQNQTTPLPNFSSTFTAPAPVWLPYLATKSAKSQDMQQYDPNEIVIQGNSQSIPTYKPMPNILPLKKGKESNIIYTN